MLKPTPTNAAAAKRAEQQLIQQHAVDIKRLLILQPAQPDQRPAQTLSYPAGEG